MVGENESHLILNTPLSPDWPEDRLYWWLNSNGTYSMRSGYWLAKLGHVRDWFNDVHEREGLLEISVGPSGPLKLNHFVWRACKGALAVKERLYDRYIIPSKECQICGSSSESIIHAIFFCKNAQEVWSKTNMLQLINESPMNSFAELLLWIADKTSSNELIVFLSLAWAVWSCRNKIIYEKDQPNVDCMARGFVALVEDYHLHNYKPKVWVAAACGVRSSSRWTCSPVGHVKINVDAQVRDDGIIGFGAVIRDHRGKIQVATVHHIWSC
ncbi:hypothetical protein RDABS01_007880 [Bienertia sinuspersici]